MALACSSLCQSSRSQKLHLRKGLIWIFSVLEPTERGLGVGGTAKWNREWESRFAEVSGKPTLEWSLSWRANLWGCFSCSPAVPVCRLECVGSSWRQSPEQTQSMRFKIMNTTIQTDTWGILIFGCWIERDSLFLFTNTWYPRLKTEHPWI